MRGRSLFVLSLTSEKRIGISCLLKRRRDVGTGCGVANEYVRGAGQELRLFQEYGSKYFSLRFQRYVEAILGLWLPLGSGSEP